MKYIGWSMNFPCKTVTIEYLQKEAKEMEGELEEWIKEVARARSTFYELNYYTTQQLLVLRGELVKVKMSDIVTPSYHMTQVIALLQSISSKVTVSNLQRVVKGISLQKDNRPLLSSLSLVDSIECTLPDKTPSIAPVCNSEPSTALQLSVEELNVDQKMWYNTIIELGYHKSISLRALKEVGHGDWNEVYMWLMKNAEYNESDVLCEEEEEESGSELGDEVTSEPKDQDLPAG